MKVSTFSIRLRVLCVLGVALLVGACGKFTGTTIRGIVVREMPAQTLGIPARTAYLWSASKEGDKVSFTVEFERTVKVAEDGTFEFADVPPGTYVIAYTSIPDLSGLPIPLRTSDGTIVLVEAKAGMTIDLGKVYVTR